MAVGLALGAALSRYAGRALEDLLIGVSPRDGLTLVTVILVLGAAALVACLSPARRAARLDPVRALRQE